MFRVELTFGHKDCLGNDLLPHMVEEAEDTLLKAFAQFFRGARLKADSQIERHLGCYKSDKSEEPIMLEKGTTIWTYTEKIYESQIDKLKDIAGDMAVILRQQTILIQISELKGQIFWVEPKPGPFALIASN